MKHRGEILHKVIAEKGVNLTFLSNRLKINRRTIYNWFDTADLPLEKVVQVGIIIGYDFSEELPEMVKFFPRDNPENIDYKKKYFELLEETNKLLNEKLRKAAEPKLGYGKKK